MKIGILTHHYINNFGAFLQAYALRQAIEKLFPEDEVLIVNYVNIKHFVINTGGWLRYYKDSENFAAWIQKIKLPITFYKVRHRHLPMTKLCLTVNQVNNLNLDCIIVGSDEVWNYAEGKGNDKIKFGSGLNCKKLIAYAPSVGKTDSKNGIPNYVKNGLNKFSALSARDRSTRELVKEATGRDAVRVLDPTFLAKFPKSGFSIPKQPYILFYYCEKMPEKLKKSIIDYAKSNKMKIYGAGECNTLYNSVTVNVTPFEWIEMFRNADYVFTGTFHGAVFSILNKKQFACYLTNPSRIQKVTDLLNDLEISDRSIDEELSVIHKKINYDKVYEAIQQKRNQSITFLKENIRL